MAHETSENVEYWYTILRKFLIDHPYILLNEKNYNVEIFNLLKDEGFYKKGASLYINNQAMRICGYCNYPIHIDKKSHIGPCSLDPKPLSIKRIKLHLFTLDNVIQEPLFVANQIIWKSIIICGIPEIILYNRLEKTFGSEMIKLYPNEDLLDISISKKEIQIGIDVKATKKDYFIIDSIIKDIQNPQMTQWDLIIYSIVDFYYSENRRSNIISYIDQYIFEEKISPLVQYRIMSTSETVGYLEMKIRS